MFTMNVFLISSMTLQLHLNILFNNQCVFGPASARPYKIGVVGNNWMVGNAVFSETAESIFSDFLNEVRGLIKVEKWQPDFEKNCWFGDIRRKVSKLTQNQTLIFFSKTALTIFLVFGLKLVLNITFNLNETYFSEKIAIWRYLTLKSSKNCPNWDLSPFSRLCIIGFLWFCT